MASTVEAGLHWTARRIVRIVTDYLGFLKFVSMQCDPTNKKRKVNFRNLWRLPKGSGAHGRAVPAGGRGGG